MLFRSVVEYIFAYPLYDSIFSSTNKCISFSTFKRLQSSLLKEGMPELGVTDEVANSIFTYFLLFISFAGFPPTTEYGGKSLVRTDAIAMMDPSAIVLPGVICTSLPIHTSLPI